MSKHLARHERGHTTAFAAPTKYTLNHDGLDCQFCGRSCKNRNSLCNHERLCKQNPEAMKPTGYAANLTIHKGHPAWNKGLSKETDARVAKMANTIKNRNEKLGSNWTGRHHSLESRRKIALSVAGNTRGNRSKKGYYKGMYCGSSYELAYVIYNLDHNIPFAKCDRYYEYEHNGSKHLYFPDFELVDGTIIEIKGYHTDLVDIKAAAVKDRPIKILYKKDLLPYLAYVFNTYNVTEQTLYTLFDKEG
jgi:hypothetical protein